MSFNSFFRIASTSSNANTVFFIGMAFVRSYDSVQKFVKKILINVQSKGSQELIWEPGCTQVDFGEVPNAKCSNPTLDKLSKNSKKENTVISDNVLSTHP